jgi:uncharacterized repeat protein (TIGR03803 family)
VLYSFTDAENGLPPYPSGLVIDAQGNRYSTTEIGGAYLEGSVVEVTPTGTERVLYSFRGHADGKTLEAGLIRDAQGNLYGTTYEGRRYGCGTVFKLTP